MNNDLSPEHFFVELLADTVRQYKKSVSKLCNYAVCATPIVKSKPILFGINWGGSDDVPPQSGMPTGEDISEYHFIKKSRHFLEEQCGLNFSNVNFNYTNLCFIRIPKQHDLSDEDYKLSLPLFKKYVSYIDPPWLLSIGVTNINRLISLGVLSETIKPHGDNDNKFKGYSGKLWDWGIYAVPPPGARLSRESRDTIWTKVTTEIKDASGR